MNTCPVCARYSDRFATTLDRDNHLKEVHPTSPESSQTRKPAPFGELIGKQGDKT